MPRADEQHSHCLGSRAKHFSDLSWRELMPPTECQRESATLRDVRQRTIHTCVELARLDRRVRIHRRGAHRHRTLIAADARLAQGNGRDDTLMTEMVHRAIPYGAV